MSKKMETDEFDGLLQLARLTNKDFEIINNMHKGSILNWKKKEIPDWVKPWLENYIKGQAHYDMIKTDNKRKKDAK